MCISYVPAKNYNAFINRRINNLKAAQYETGRLFYLRGKNLMKKAYEWAWLEEDGERFLSIKFNEKLVIKDFLNCFSEAFPDFGGGDLKLLVDRRDVYSELDYNEDITVLHSKLLNFGVDKCVSSIVVTDRAYYFKEIVINEYSKINKRPLFIKSFNDYDTAKKWLIDYKL